MEQKVLRTEWHCDPCKVKNDRWHIMQLWSHCTLRKITDVKTRIKRAIWRPVFFSKNYGNHVRLFATTVYHTFKFERNYFVMFTYFYMKNIFVMNYVSCKFSHWYGLFINYNMPGLSTGGLKMSRKKDGTFQLTNVGRVLSVLVPTYVIEKSPFHYLFKSVR